MINEQDFIDEVIRLCSKSDQRNIINNETDVLGLALLNLGHVDPTDPRLRTKNILRNYFCFSRLTSYWADKIQYHQDLGLSWERAMFETNCYIIRGMLNEGTKNF